jgi:hypothetical protein
MHLPAFASTGRFPGGPASANFFLSLLGRNGSSARPLSPRSRLLQLQQEIKKEVYFSKKRVNSALSSIQEKLFPPERPVETPVGISAVRRSFSMAQAMENS